MNSKQSERLEDIQKKYSDANKAYDNLEDSEPNEDINVKETVKYLKLINDVATCWNSSYLAWSKLIYLKE
ncbi:hypothetical protein C1645_822302 [Glomus cerebriforme]|uniref:Uncharacterized protein n=1 Tax=Glomus cerebriforme TaxID=658196 RepID=A0A397T802_9GLOM|nr:hypothetical protein C1645_822302 [Glomus cerebriforme]